MKIIEELPKGKCVIEFQDKFKVKKVIYNTNFLEGKVKNPYDRTNCGVGYMGVGQNKSVLSNGKHTREYSTWNDMIVRCYKEEERHKHPAYVDCVVCDEWQNFQTFVKWYHKNYYDIGEGRMHLDKDILNKGNKIYNPEYCVFVPQRINLLFVTRKSERGDLPCGVSKNSNDTYNVTCGIDTGIVENLGTYATIEDAFNSYKIRKEQNIKEVADQYKNRIPKKLYKALYNWKVEIDD